MSIRYPHCLPALLLLVAASTAPSADAAQAYDNCTGFIDSVPAVIATQGTWCLRKDLASSLASGELITINAHNVTLDCNDFKIAGVAAGKGTRTVGIYTEGRLNATIRRCNVRGFYYGIALFGDGHVVEDNLLVSNTFFGIYAKGDGSLVRRNRVLDTGGITGLDYHVQGFGIETSGKSDIVDNIVDGVFATAGTNGYAIAIETVNNPAGAITGNLVRDIVPDGTGLADGISVYGPGTGRVVVAGNQLLGLGHNPSYGVVCPEAAGNRVVVQDNIVIDWNVGTGPSCSFVGENTVIAPAVAP